MNLGFVEAFYWAATLKSVSRAAKKLYITQPATSARIAVLERELGVPLLDRRDHHFGLTVAGQRFLGEAERLLDLWRSIRTDLGTNTEGPTSLRVGAIESVSHAWLIPWIARTKEERPGLQLELTVETTPVLGELVRRGAADVVIASVAVVGENIRSVSLTPMPMAFVARSSLHKRRRHSLREVAKHDLLTFQRGSHPHTALLEMFRAAGVDPPRVHAISSISAMLRLAASGFGVATLPHAAVDARLEADGLRVLRCETELAPLPIHVSWRLDPSSDHGDAVVESITQFAGLAARERRRAHKKTR